MFIVTDQNIFIREESICYIRHIKKLVGNYDVTYYPEYSIFLNNMYFFISNLSQLNLSTYIKIDDTIPENAYLGYPTQSEITYYIKLKKVNIICPDFEYVTFHFSQNLKLIIHDKNILEKINLH